MPYIQKITFETYVKNWEPPKKEWKCSYIQINNSYRELNHEMGKYYCDRGLCAINGGRNGRWEKIKRPLNKLHPIKIKEFEGDRILNVLVCDYCKDRIKVE